VLVLIFGGIIYYRLQAGIFSCPAAGLSAVLRDRALRASHLSAIKIVALEGQQVSSMVKGHNCSAALKCVGVPCFTWG
jgi:hypothetical protein